MAQTQVEPEEAQAILDAVRADDGHAPSGASVAARDFGRPLRLSERTLAEVGKRIAAALPAAEKELGRALRGAHTLSVSELREESAEGLFDDVGPAFVVLRFEVAGQPGWLRWDVAGAVAALEVVLGAPEATPNERPLSGVERSLAGRLLGDLLTRLTQAVGVTPSDPRMIAKADDLGSWRDAGARADRARLRVRLELDGPAGHGGLDLFLPGVRVEDDEEPVVEGAVPQHLDAVAVELSAQLGTCDVPLRELLELAVGDVVPLDTPDDADLTVLVEDVPCAVARLGTHEGMLALQILDLTRPDEDS